jgi:hypothetical protein
MWVLSGQTDMLVKIWLRLQTHAEASGALNIGCLRHLARQSLSGNPRNKGNAEKQPGAGI